MELREQKQRKDDSKKEDPSRDSFSRDRARIIHSAFFRRLQGKTQVLGLGESDFYRTRLTHSIEVAQIASGIVEKLKTDEKNHLQLPSSHLIEAIALAHDIGHPPFGHGGEVALNYAMRNSGGFEGNAQTLRICTKLGEYSEKNGLNLTRRTLLGILKYPEIHSSVVDRSLYNEERAPTNIDSFKPPKCIFDCENDELDFITSPFESNDKSLLRQTIHKPKSHKKTIHKGLDTSIMELADDIAYGVHDLEDAIALKLVARTKWNDAVFHQFKECSTDISSQFDEISDLLFSEDRKKRKSAISRLVTFFINECFIEKNDNFSDPTLSLNAKIPDETEKQLKILKDFVVANVIKTPEVQTLEYKGQKMILKLFSTIADNPERLLPSKYLTEYKEKNDDLRIICDYLAGTTDLYAIKLYHKLFTPSTGSIFDKL